MLSRFWISTSQSRTSEPLSSFQKSTLSHDLSETSRWYAETLFRFPCRAQPGAVEKNRIDHPVSTARHFPPTTQIPAVVVRTSELVRVDPHGHREYLSCIQCSHPHQSPDPLDPLTSFSYNPCAAITFPTASCGLTLIDKPMAVSQPLRFLCATGIPVLISSESVMAEKNTEVSLIEAGFLALTLYFLQES
jgi:hypothetical protein